MADVDRLLRQFIEDDRARGDADPLTYLQQLEGSDRAELEALIDGYLARAPRRPFDAQRFGRSSARGVAEELARSLGGASGTWPALLPRLRHRSRLRRADVIERLAHDLGAREGQVAKVARYYHGMEQGTLPAAGVSDRVLEVLGRIVGVSPDHLREAGRGVGGAGPGRQGAVAFARVGSPDPEYVEAESLTRSTAADGTEPPDDIDELFTSAGAS